MAEAAKAIILVWLKIRPFYMSNWSKITCSRWLLPFSKGLSKIG